MSGGKVDGLGLRRGVDLVRDDQSVVVAFELQLRHLLEDRVFLVPCLVAAGFPVGDLGGVDLKRQRAARGRSRGGAAHVRDRELLQPKMYSG